MHVDTVTWHLRMYEYYDLAYLHVDLAAHEASQMLMAPGSGMQFVVMWRLHARS